MKFPIDITKELRNARASQARKLRLANYGVAAAASLVAVHYGMLIACSTNPIAPLVCLAILLWGSWGFWTLINR